METARIDICYRPLRIAWAVHSADREAFRRAVRLTHTMWGGRFNPIVFVDRPDEARALIELFRVDHIVPLGDSPEVGAICKHFPYLITPYFPDKLFLNHRQGSALAHVLDVHNALSHWSSRSEWSGLKEHGFRRVNWTDDDPLTDALLLQYGAYPPIAETGIDYVGILAQATEAIDLNLDNGQAIDAKTLDHPGIGFIARHAIQRHYSVQAGWSYPGFFVGEANDFDDLAAFWNLRAADIPLYFIDRSHPDRYRNVIPKLKHDYKTRLANLPEHRRHLAIWTRQDAHFDPIIYLLGEGEWLRCKVGKGTWNGLNVRPPMMIFGEASALGVIGRSGGRPTVSFTLNDKPFNNDRYFHTQQLIASVQVYGTPGEQHTFHPPYVPELNEALARSMIYQYDKLRIEPERIGIIVDAADHDAHLHAMSNPELIERIFALSGLTAKPSSGGLIARQLIASLGGVDGARVFKIPGVRRLLKTHGPNAAFTKKSALQLIGQTDPRNPEARFASHENLYIEPRPTGTKLTQQMVFGYLVEKGLFRIGMELKCPSCKLPSWIALDALHQSNTCEMCGRIYDATRQLVESEFRYRRTGVLGIEKNTQGAIPVVLLLQQLSVNLDGSRGDLILAPSYSCCVTGC